MSEPHICPVCARAFAWGLDADSRSVEAKGEQWLSCRENAHWKLNFHMQDEHPDAGFLCPRRGESAPARGKDWWGERDGHKACSYCGSISSDELFAAIEAGHQLGPTDKSYKVYVDLPNPNAGQTVEIGSESGPAYRDDKPTRDDLTYAEKLLGRYERKIVGTAGPTVHAKFYFQHLNDAERQRFLDLLNAKKINIGVPGRFYRLPFFCHAVEPAPTSVA